MREIKFRAWDETSKIMDSSMTLDDFTIFFRACAIEEDGTGYRQYSNGEQYQCHFIIEQYTGLKDKKGQDIYEGDIVRLDSWKGTQQIKFIEGAFCLAFLGGEFDGEYAGDIHYIQHAGRLQSTVIGNIHENPELLEV